MKSVFKYYDNSQAHKFEFYQDILLYRVEQRGRIFYVFILFSKKRTTCDSFAFVLKIFISEILETVHTVRPIRGHAVSTTYLSPQFL